MNLNDLNDLKEKAIRAISEAVDLEALERLRVAYFGRKGKMAEILSQLKNMAIQERAKAGQEINRLKKEIEAAMESKKQELFAWRDAAKEWIDVTMPGKKLPRGHLHPRTIIIRKMEEIFQSLGFSVVDGPEIETDFYNFQALNIPPDHPARDMQATFYINGGDNKKETPISLSQNRVLRTQTSPVQVRYMERHQPPLRIIVPGRVFRRDATDASHDCQFYQLEGLMVDKEISVANFKAVLLEFFKRFYGQSVKIRLRPSYFPFTEPSFEVDMSCTVCAGKGCRVCSHSGWLETAGAGMVHPNVFLAAGYKPRLWQGFAFGFGIDRIVMMKYKINDIRLLNSGDLRFLRQF